MPKRAKVQALIPGNNLLSHLRPQELALFRNELEPVRLEQGDVVADAGEVVKYVHFPCGSCLMSYMVVLPEGQEIEAGHVGHEGAVGGVVSMGRLPAFTRCEVQVAGNALRVHNADLEAAKQQSPVLREIFARYADCQLAQLYQSVACNAAHSVEQRAAKWLASVAELTQMDKVAFRQEQLALMFGVGRTYVTRVMARLADAGAIEVKRGGVNVINAEKLRQAACGCNDAVKDHFHEVLRGVYPDLNNPADSKA